MSSITYGTGTYDGGFALPVVRTRLRLTRRGRAVIAVLVSLPLVIALVMLAVNGGGATATSGLEQSIVQQSTVTVQAGQSLWSLAGTLAPEANPADVVADILAINGLDTASVQPGQVLIVPERYAG
jgi:nucleoid-associated protein YgaU